MNEWICICKGHGKGIRGRNVLCFMYVRRDGMDERL